MPTDVLGYLTSKGLQCKRADKRNVNLPCIFCNEPVGKRGRLYVNVDEDAEIPGLFFCHLCGEKGSLKSIQRFYGDDTSTAADPGAQHYEIMRAAAHHFHMALGHHPEAVAYFQNERGLSVETIKRFKLGWAEGDLVPKLKRLGFADDAIRAAGFTKDGREFFKDVYTIPYYVGNQTCVGIRQKEPGGKYKQPSGWSQRLFNLDAARGASEAIITEGEFDCMLATQMGYAAVGCPGAGQWQESWNAYFDKARRVFVVFDNDDAGRKGAAKIRDLLGPKARPVTMPPKPGGDDEDHNDLSDWIVAQNHSADQFADLLKKHNPTLLVTVAEAMAEWLSVQGAEGLKFGFERLDRAITPGLLPGQVVVALAKTNCLAGDTEVITNRGGGTRRYALQDFVRLHNSGRRDPGLQTYIQRANEDGTIRLAEVAAAWCSGQRETWTVTAESGRTIRATLEHPFLTPDGFVKLADLAVGDNVMLNGGRSCCGRAKRPPYRQKGGLRFHPFATRRNLATGGWSVQAHRVVMEAHLNAISVEEFVRRCRIGGTEGLHFIDPAVQEVHHRDGDPQNNRLDNLVLIEKRQHDVLHADASHVLERIIPERIVSIERYGWEETYDVEVVDDPHNFLANGFVVHNTGKTLWLINVFERMSRKNPDLKFLFISLEQTKGDWFERAQRLRGFYSINDLAPLSYDAAEIESYSVEIRAQTLKYWQDRMMLTDANRMSPEHIRESIDDYVRIMGGKPDVLAIDYLGYLARAFKGASRYEQVSEAVMTVKEIAKDYGIPILTPAQTNRSAGFGQKLEIDQARDAGAIEETADFVFGLHNPDHGKDQQDPNRTGQIILDIGKSRHGGKDERVHYQWGKRTLAMVPPEDRQFYQYAAEELQYGEMDWRWVIAKHRTGKQAPNR